jgi:acyl carrier protein
LSFAPERRIRYSPSPGKPGQQGTVGLGWPTGVIFVPPVKGRRRPPGGAGSGRQGRRKWEEDMESNGIREKVVDIICRKLDVPKEKVSDATKYTEDLGADSLDQAELVMEFEDEFDINIPDEAEGKIKTVGDTIKFIEELLKTKA